MMKDQAFVDVKSFSLFRVKCLQTLTRLHYYGYKTVQSNELVTKLVSKIVYFMSFLDYH